MSQAQPSNSIPKISRTDSKKWLKMTKFWSYYHNNKYNRILCRCRKGIPDSVRGLAWFHLTGAHMKGYPNIKDFNELLKTPIDLSGARKIYNDVRLLGSSFLPDKSNQKGLFNVLKAYSAFRPKIGYYELQFYIAALLVTHMPPEESFWTLVRVLEDERYLGGYLTCRSDEKVCVGGTERLTRDREKLNALLKKRYPAVYTHLQEHKLDPAYLLLCGMSGTLMRRTVSRVWDCFLNEGFLVLFKMALAILATLEKDEIRQKLDSQNDTLKHLDRVQRFLKDESIVQSIVQMDLSYDDIGNALEDPDLY